MTDTHNRAARVYRLLKHGRWVDYHRIAAVAGLGGYRSALTEARRKFKFETDNLQGRLPSGATTSKYRIKAA